MSQKYKENINIYNPEVENISHVRLHDALMHVQDVLDRALCPFVVLGRIARQMLAKDIPVLEDSKIEIGILKNHMMPSTESIIKMVDPTYKREGNNATMDYMGVPIEIKIIQKDYPFFKFPDTRFYYLSEFKFPNPFNNYWAVRKEIE